MKARAFALLVVASTLACKTPAPAPPADPFEVPRESGALVLARSTTKTAPTEGFKVYVGREFVSADSPPKKVTKLADVVPSGIGHVVVFFDRATPYRVVTQTITTLASRWVPRLELATVDGSGRTTAIEVRPARCQPTQQQFYVLPKVSSPVDAKLAPSAAAPPLRTPYPIPPEVVGSTSVLPLCPTPSSPHLGLVVHLAPDGLSIDARNGHVAPGCKDVGDGTTIPKSRGDTLDFDGLRACLDQVKRVSSDFESETELVLSAPPETRFETIVAMMDAARSGPDAGVLFPRILFALPK